MTALDLVGPEVMLPDDGERLYQSLAQVLQSRRQFVLLVLDDAILRVRRHERLLEQRAEAAARLRPDQLLLQSGNPTPAVIRAFVYGGAWHVEPKAVP